MGAVGDVPFTSTSIEGITPNTHSLEPVHTLRSLLTFSLFWLSRQHAAWFDLSLRRTAGFNWSVFVLSLPSISQAAFVSLSACLPGSPLPLLAAASLCWDYTKEKLWLWRSHQDWVKSSKSSPWRRLLFESWPGYCLTVNPWGAVLLQCHFSSALSFGIQHHSYLMISLFQFDLRTAWTPWFIRNLARR